MDISNQISLLPLTNMQQLVSHWKTIMTLPTQSRKRGRGAEEPDVRTKTQVVERRETTDHAQSETPRGPWCARKT